MKKLFVAALLLVSPLLAQPSDLDWIKVTMLPGDVNGISGMARLAPDRYLICDGGLLRELAMDSLSLIPVQGESIGGLNDMEAVCAMPGAPGRFLVVSADQVHEVIRNADESYSAGSFTKVLPRADVNGDGVFDGGNDFEGFDVAEVNGLTFAVWGDRGEGWISYSPFDPSLLDTLSSPESFHYSSPLAPEEEGEHLFEISDLKVRPNGELIIVSNSRNSNEGGPLVPYRSCVAIPGRFVTEVDELTFQRYDAPKVLLMGQTNLMIEGLELTEDGLLLASEDDGSSHILKLSLEDLP